MLIQPVTYQPNYKGKLKGMNGVMILKDSYWDIPAGMDAHYCFELPDNLVNKMRNMVKEKPYDVFVSPNKNNLEFVNVDADTSFENVEKGIQGRIKVARDAIMTLPKAIQDAMDLFEENLANLTSKTTKI